VQRGGTPVAVDHVINFGGINICLQGLFQVLSNSCVGEMFFISCAKQVSIHLCRYVLMD
jgi:hypothetical protein